MNHFVWDFSPCLRDNTIQHISGKSLRRQPENYEDPRAIFHSHSPNLSRPHWGNGKIQAAQVQESMKTQTVSQAEVITPVCCHPLACLLTLSFLINKGLLQWYLNVNKAICDLINPDGRVCPFRPSPFYQFWTILRSFSPCGRQFLSAVFLPWLFPVFF